MQYSEEELRQKYNPEGSNLRRQQLRMLEMLEVIDKICKKHNIQYWLSSGTLLGAVRHKGFIPWDDDLDIELLREDYLRLLKVLPSELPDNMALQSNEEDPNYIFIFAKVRDKNSYLEEYYNYERIFKERGIFIDIFPLEEIPYCLAWISKHMQGVITFVLDNKGINENRKIKWAQKIFRFNDRIGYPILRFLSKFFFNKNLLISFGTYFQKPRSMKDIFPLAEATFEGKTYPVPRDTDTFLTKYYGNYMQLPDLEKLPPQHCKKLIFYDDDKSRL